jgi:hypothetical protein
MPLAAADPAVARFVEQVSAGTNAAGDRVAGLLLRLLSRVGALEKAVAAQGIKLDNLAMMPRQVHRGVKTTDAALGTIETGIDIRDGSPARKEPKRPRGRPLGRKDSHPRRKLHSRDLFQHEDLIFE